MIMRNTSKNRHEKSNSILQANTKQMQFNHIRAQDNVISQQGQQQDLGKQNMFKQTQIKEHILTTRVQQFKNTENDKKQVQRKPQKQLKQQKKQVKLVQRSLKQSSYAIHPQQSLPTAQIYTSQFITDPQPSDQCPRTLSQNIARIISCKKQTQTLISQIQSYTELITELKLENKRYKKSLDEKNEENKILRDQLHRKNIQVIDIREERDRVTRMYVAEMVKGRILKEGIKEMNGSKWQEMYNNKLQNLGQEISAYSEFQDVSQSYQNNYSLIDQSMRASNQNRTIRSLSNQRQPSSTYNPAPSSAKVSPTQSPYQHYNLNKNKENIRISQFLDRNPESHHYSEFLSKHGKIVKSKQVSAIDQSYIRGNNQGCGYGYNESTLL